MPAFNLTPPRRLSNGANGSHHSQKTTFKPVPVSSASSAAASASSAPTSSKSAPVPMPRSTANGPGRDHSPPSSTLPSSTESSPLKAKALKAAVPPSMGPEDDATRLEQLLAAQASRRPRLMRLTPAFVSLPGRLAPSSEGPRTAPISSRDAESDFFFSDPKTKSGASSAEVDADVVQVGGSARTARSTSANSSAPSANASSRRPGKGTGVLEPPAGLLLDMTNLPTPSADDKNGPRSTSDLPEVRTKQGRLVKPALRNGATTPSLHGRSDSGPSSVPSQLHFKSTPNTPSVPKVVQFDTHLEHIKVFRFKQRPAAISRSGSPEQTETETEEEKDLFPFVSYNGKVSPNNGTPRAGTPTILAPELQPPGEQLVLRLPNFPSSARLSIDKDVFLERIHLAEDLRSVRGTVRVRNLSFEKWVAVRFTLDNWITVNEVSAEHSESINGGTADRFTFSIKLNELLNWPRGAGQHETKTMFLCLRFNARETEHWDNNDGLNYQLDFKKRSVPITPLPTPDIGRRERAQTISGPIPAAAPHAKAFEMATRHGVQASKGGAFVEELRRELDKLKTEEEDIDRPPVVTKKMFPGGSLARPSPPASPDKRPSSPMWSARYDWGESLRNSSSAKARTRAAVHDYFEFKPVPSTNGSQPLPNQPQLLVSEASPNSQHSSDSSTPLAHFHGQTTSGMFSPAVGDNIAHHRPVLPSTTPSLDNSMSNSATASPVRPAVSLAVPGQEDVHRTNVRGGGSPVERVSTNNFFADAAGGAGSTTSSAASTEISEDEAEEHAEEERLSRSTVNARIVTMSRATMKTRVDKKGDGMVLEDYDECSSPTGQPATLISPRDSESSQDTESPGLTTPEETGTALTSFEDDEMRADRTTAAPARRRWSPSPMGARARPVDFSSASSSPARSLDGTNERTSPPRLAADLSELIQKYCWSNEQTPGTTALSSMDAVVLGGSSGIAMSGSGVDSPKGLSPYEMRSPVRSGTATPTADRG